MSERTCDKIRGGVLHGNVTSRKMEAAIENLSGGIVRALLTRTMLLESSKNIKIFLSKKFSSKIFQFFSKNIFRVKIFH